MVIVVTGSSGFIGRNLLEMLGRTFPDAEIRRLVRAPAGRATDYPVDYCDVETIYRSPALEGADYLFHVAGVTRGYCAQDFRNANVLPVRNILEALTRRRIPLRRFLLVSSQAAGGPSRSLTHFRTEEEAPEPFEMYGRSKLEAERVALSYDGSVPVTIIRPGVVFGPHDVEFLNIFRLTRFGLNLYPGYRHRYVSYVYVMDLVRAIVDAARSENTVGRTYYICNDRPASWKEIHETAFAVCGRRGVSVNIPYAVLLPISCAVTAVVRPFARKVPLLRPQGLRISRPDFWIASNASARRDFNFAPSYDLAEGLWLTHRWYSQAGMI